MDASVDLGRQQEYARDEPGADLDRFFDAPLDLLCIADVSGRFRRVNRAWTQLLGYRADELEGRSFLDFVHPDDRSATLMALEALGSGREVMQFVNRYLGGDGKYHWLEWRTQPDGGLVYASARDVTKRMLAGQALRESQKKLEDLMLVVGDWIWETDAERRYVSCSDGVRKVLGYEPEEVIGRTPWDFMVPEDVKRLLPRAIEEGRNGLGCVDVINRNRHRDGRTIVVQTSCVPILDADGKTIGFRGVDKDVTGAVRAEEALRDSVVRLDALWRISATVAAPGDLVAALSKVAKDIREVLGAAFVLAVIFGEGIEGRQLITDDLAESARYEVAFSRRSVAHFSLLEEMAQGGVPVAINGFDTGLVPPAMRLEAERLGFSSALVVPLVLRAEVTGALVITQPTAGPPFDEDEKGFVQAAAASIAAAIAHSRLRQEERVRTASQVRDHLARELHDAVTQSVYSASLMAESLPVLLERSPDDARAGIAQMRRLVRSALAELRILLYELRPSTIEDVQFSQLLARLADSLAGQSDLEVDVRVEPAAEGSLPGAVKVALYRIAQEAFNNIAKHAHAHHVSAFLESTQKGILLSVQDDGKGFPARLRRDCGAMGLDIMRERAREVGAVCDIQPAEPAGTRVVVHWAPSAVGQVAACPEAGSA